MNDLLNWIARNGNVAFILGVFLLIFFGGLLALLRSFFDFLIRLARAFTGKYPLPETPRPIVQCNGSCDCSKPCLCCEEDECKVGCGCSSLLEES